MLREDFTKALKIAMVEKDTLKTTTIRMILAGIKDKDIQARAKDNPDGIADDAILSLLQSLIKQRNDSVKLYQEAGRQELVDKELAEIKIIQSFLPQQLSEVETNQAIADAMKETNATSMKDMGKIMAALKAKYAGKMDFSKASQLIKTHF